MKRLLFFLLCLYPLSARAGNPDYLEIRCYGRENGLSNLSVRDIVCDRDGEIWIATRDGLNRYDGYSFTTYRTDPDNPSSIGCNVLECLEAGEDGCLWVGTDTGFSRYDPALRKFFNYSIPSGHVLDIVQMDASTLFIRNGNSGLFFDIPSSKFIEEYGPVKISDYSSLVVIKADGRLFFSGPDRIETLSDGKLDVFATIKGPVRSIVRIDDTLWIFRNNNSLHTYNLGNGVLAEYRAENLFNRTRDVDFLGQSVIFATSNGIVTVLDGARGEDIDIFPSDGNGYHIPVNSLQKDLQDGLWVTSFHDGIGRICTIPTSSFSPAPILTGLSVNGEDILPARGGILEKDIRFTEKVRLRGKVSELKVSFSVINQASRGNNSFKYQMEGCEKQWHEQDNRAPAVYKNLRRGQYCFHLMSANDRGVWSEDERALTIYIGMSLLEMLLLFFLPATGGLVMAVFLWKRRRVQTLRIPSSTEGMEYVLKGQGRESATEESQAFIRKTVGLIEKNISDSNYSASKLATDLGMSRSSMYNRLSDLLGMGTGKLMSTIRLELARHMISNAICGIEETSEKTGFSSAAYFSSCFKKYFGRSPKKYLPLVVLGLLMGSGLEAAPRQDPLFKEIRLPEQLSQRPLVSLVQGPDGFMWMSDGFSAMRYDGKTFTGVGFEGKETQDLVIKQLVRDRTGRIWALTSEGAWKYDAPTRSFTDALSFHKAAIYGISDAGNGLVLVASSLGTRVCSLQGEETIAGIFPRNDLKFKCLEPLGKFVYMLENDGGLYRWDKDTGEISFVVHAGQDAVGIRPVLDNLFWIRRAGKGTHLFKVAGDSLTEVEESMDPLFFTRDGGKDSLRYVDDNGGRWCVSVPGKVYYAQPGNGPFSFLPGKDGNNLFSSSIISCIAAGKDGSVWMGRPGEGNVIRYDPATSDTVTFHGIKASDTKCIIPLEDRVYVGFYSGGLQVIDLKSGKVRHVPGLKCVRTALPWKDGKILLTSNSELYCFDSRSERISKLKLDKWASSYGKKMYLTSDGELWIASERGVQVYLDEEDGWKPYEEELFSQIRRATDIIQDREGTVWITTEYGLWTYEPSSHSLKEFQPRNEMPANASLYSVETDSSGLLWVSGSDGLFSVNPGNGFVKKYSGDNCYLCDQYASGASASCHDGRLLFAGVGGVTVLSPGKTAFQSSVSCPFISKIEYDGKALSPADREEIVYPRKNNSLLLVSVLVPDISSSDLCSISCRVDGKEVAVPDGNPVLVSIPPLKYGSHVISFETLYNTGEGSGATQNLNVKVVRSDNEYLLIGASGLVLISLAITLILRRRKKSRKKREFLSSVSKTVEENLSEKDFSVAEFASKMGVSKKYLYDILRKYWKTTPSVYIREERLRVARNLLETSSLTVSEISERVGFSSPSYFVSVFRKETGTTPLNYKQKRK